MVECKETVGVVVAVDIVVVVVAKLIVESIKSRLSLLNIVRKKIILMNE